MSARSRWLAMNYGGGAAVVLCGLVMMARLGWATGLPVFVVGICLLLAARTTESAYVAGYWRGRVDQLDDVRYGIERSASDIDPHPWDSQGGARHERY